MADRERERWFIERPTKKIDEAERKLNDLRERFDEVKKSIPGDVIFDAFADSDAETGALLVATFGAIKAYMDIVGVQTEMIIDLNKKLDGLDKNLTNMRLEIAEISDEKA